MSKKNLLISVSLFVGVFFIASACRKDSDQTVTKNCAANCSNSICSANRTATTCPGKQCKTGLKTCQSNCQKSCCSTNTCPADCQKSCCAKNNTAALTNTTEAETDTAVSEVQQNIELPIEQTKCPVTSREINRELFAKYNEQKIYFCCSGCKEKFLANPEQYSDKLPQLK